MVGGNGNLPSFMKPKPAELVIIRAIRAKGELPGPASVEASFIPSWTPNATLPVFYDTDFFSSSSRLQVSLRRISSIFSSTTPPWSILSSPRVDSYEELAELVSQPGRHSARIRLRWPLRQKEWKESKDASGVITTGINDST